MRHIWNLFRRSDTDDEIESHIEERTAELVDAGVPPRDARLRARREFGNVALTQENSRAVWGWTWLERLAQDLRYAVRMLVRTPGFTAVAVLSLGLGIGANTAIFGLLDVLLFRMLPVERPQDLKLVNVRWEPSSKPSRSLTYPSYRLLLEGNHSFTDLATAGSFAWQDRSASGERGWHDGALVSGNYFDVLGVRAAAGRTLTPADDAVEGSGRADGIVPAMLSYRYWRRAYQRDPAVIGKEINVNGRWATVVGVAAPEFFGTQVGAAPDIFLPIQAQPVVMAPRNLLHDGPQGSTTWVTVMGRLRPGVAEDQAKGDLTIPLQRYQQARRSPDSRSKPLTARMEFEPGGRGISRLRERFSDPLKVLMLLVGFVLLIACANLANLLLARTRTRRKEIAVRLAIGAGRGRIVRQLLTESLLLSIVGGAIGLAFALWSSGLLVRMLPQTQVPIALAVTLDARLLAFTFGLSTLTGLLFGVAPALRETRAGVNTDLKQVPGQSGRRPRFDASRALVVAQIALTAPLVVGAGLFIGTLRNLVREDAGFVQENVVQVRIDADDAGLPRDRWPAVYSQLLERVKNIPGVHAVSIANRGLMEQGRTQSGLLGIPGYTFRPDEPRELPETYIASEYFAVSGIPLRLGRSFTAREEEGSAHVAIVNETMAQRYFAGRNPVGLSFSLGTSPATVIEIVGVVADAKYNDLRENSVAMAYYPWRQVGVPRMNSLMVRGQGDARGLSQALRQAVTSIHPDLFLNVRTLTSQIEETLVRERMLASLSGFLGVLALLVACLGLYGVLSYGVSRRTAEIGLRVALGARPSEVAGMVLRETMVLVALGVAMGLGLALALSRLAASMLYGLEPNDPVVVALASGALAMVGVIAAYLPARRAARVDPLIALRYE